MWHAVVLGVALIGARPAVADVWDSATANDNSVTTTRNDLIHGSEQAHDLGDVVAGVTADDDWFNIVGGPYSSYEAVVDGITGDLDDSNNRLVLDRTGTTGSVIQSATSLGVGTEKHVAWDDNALPFLNKLHVTSPLCPGCTVDDQYRIRFFETTCAIPRFNNSTSQVTVVILQNTAPYGLLDVHGHYWMLSATGVVLNPGSNSFTLVPGGTFVRNTAADAPGGSGAIYITNDTGYGAVAGKAVALEPATGFTFDTALNCLPH